MSNNPPILTPGEQEDGSIVDLNGNIISSEEKEGIIKSVLDLPATKKVDDILYGLKESPIILVKGETGSGKSTQIGKVALDYLESKGEKSPQVILTQPRVAAATGLANRVSKELLSYSGDVQWSLGYGVGYRTGRGKSSKDISPLSFHTAGYELMRQVTSDHNGHVKIRDEFHTDDISNTIGAYIERLQLLKNPEAFKLIITSATINTLKTLDYFAPISRDIPIIDIEGRTFDIEKIYARSADFSKYFSEQYSKGDNILIFEEGKNEIKETMEEVKHMVRDDTKIFAFHSELSIEEQREIIDYKPEKGEQVIIVATDSAEESLTVSYINTVIDKGNHKDASINNLGVSRLDSKATSKASAKQRIGRTGRVAPGTGIRVNDKGYKTLDDFPEAPITKTTLEKEILILAKKGISLKDELAFHYGEGTKMFTDNPSDVLVNLSYKRLYMIGAINKMGLTEMGEKILSFPLSVFNARVLIEAIDRGVSKDMLEIVAIIEHNGFLLNEGDWQGLYAKKKSRARSKLSDLSFQLGLLRDLLSKNLSEGNLDFFSKKADFGFEWRDEYQGETMLFEHIEEEKLDQFGVNKRSLQKIAETIEELKKRCESNDIELTDSGSNDDMILSIISGNVHNIFKFDHKKNEFFNAFQNWGKTRFYQGKSSIIEPSQNTKDAYYVGEPFIIGGKKGEDDFNLLHSITVAEEKHIDEFKHILTQTIPNFNFKKQTEKSKARFNYIKTLRELPKLVNVDLPKLKNEKLADFIQEQEVTPEYVELYFLIKNLDKDKDKDKRKSKRQELRESFNEFEIFKSQYLEVKKKYGFISSFIEELRNLLSGEKVSLNHISLGISSSSENLMSDPVIQKFNFLYRVNNLKVLYKKIKKLSSGDVFATNKTSNANKLSDGKSYVKKNFDNFQRLFLFDNRKFRYSVNRLQKLHEKLQSIKDSKSAELNELNNKKNRDNKGKIRSLRKEIRVLDNVGGDISTFVKESLSIRKDISSIDFEEVLFTQSDSKHIVLTKKYLYSILGNTIFNGDFVSTNSNAEKKLRTRLNKYLGGSLGASDTDTIINSIKNYTSDDCTIRTKRKAERVLNNTLDSVSSYNIENSRKEQEEALHKMKKRSLGGIDDIYTGVESILSSFFEEDFILRTAAGDDKLGKEKKSLKVFNFAKKIPSLTVYNFDKELIKFMSSLGLEHSKEFGDEFKEISDYLFLKERVEKFYGKEMKSDIQDGELEALEIDEQTLHLKQTYKNAEKIKNNLKL